MGEQKYEHMDQATVARAMGEQIESVRAHLDLEGVAYIKVTRTGPQNCFSSDATCDVLKAKGMDYKEQSETFWKKPAMKKWPVSPKKAHQTR